MTTTSASTTAARKTRRTQAERTEDTRRKILDASVDLLVTRGYAGFRTADVAEAAGVSRGAQTHHFPSKDDLVVAVVEHVFQRASEQAHGRATRARPTVDEAIKALLEDSQEFFFSELFLVAIDLAIQGRFRDGDDEVGQISAATRLPVEEHWRNALVESGVPQHIADDLLWLTISIVRGLAVRRLWQHDAPRFKRLFKLWRDMVRTYLESMPDSAAQRPRRSP